MSQLIRYAINARRGAYHYAMTVAGGMLVLLCGRSIDRMSPLPVPGSRMTECRSCAARKQEQQEAAEARVVELAEQMLKAVDRSALVPVRIPAGELRAGDLYEDPDFNTFCFITEATVADGRATFTLYSVESGVAHIGWGQLADYPVTALRRPADVDPADATAGTWREDWIPAEPAPTDGALFELGAAGHEQGALFS
ncbi:MULTISPECIES: hypothetical protein [unclassified Streptomyces]|uniref:hypothetical protein n=1 Tax=unclassified Streptomyces TaxID=2593676 RepID=UPI0037F27B32